MGYTHKWNHTTVKPFTADEWRRLQMCARRIIQLSGVPVQHDFDEGGEPEISDDRIWFNGVGDNGHETFVLERDCTDFAFCKTARKPYDEIVVAILIAAAFINPEFKWKSDGNREEHADGEALAGKLEIPYTTNL